MGNKKNQPKHSNGSAKINPSSWVSLLDSDPEPKPARPILNEERKLTAEEEAIKNFKVFLKKNIPTVQPAPDLLVKIHQRIDQIQAKK